MDSVPDSACPTEGENDEAVPEHPACRRWSRRDNRRDCAGANGQDTATAPVQTATGFAGKLKSGQKPCKAHRQVRIEYQSSSYHLNLGHNVKTNGKGKWKVAFTLPPNQIEYEVGVLALEKSLGHGNSCGIATKSKTFTGP